MFLIIKAHVSFTKRIRAMVELSRYAMDVNLLAGTATSRRITSQREFKMQQFQLSVDRVKEVGRRPMRKTYSVTVGRYGIALRVEIEITGFHFAHYGESFNLPGNESNGYPNITEISNSPLGDADCCLGLRRLAVCIFDTLKLRN